MITKRFGGSEWRQRHVYLLDKMRFKFGNSEIMTSLTSLYRKIKSIYPDLSQEGMIGYVLMRLPDEVQEQITTTTKGVDDISEFLSTFHRIIPKSTPQREALRNNSHGKQSWGSREAVKSGYKKKNMSLEREKVVVPIQGSFKAKKPVEKLCLKCGPP